MPKSKTGVKRPPVDVKNLEKAVGDIYSKKLVSRSQEIKCYVNDSFQRFQIHKNFLCFYHKYG